MTARRVAVCVLLAAAASGCSTTTGDTARQTLRSQRRSVAVTVTPPGNWDGPAYQAWPSYDSFSYGHGKEDNACFLQVRFDPYRTEPGDRHHADDIAIHWNTTPLADIRRQVEREFQNPQVEHLNTVTIAGEPVRVLAVYNADGDSFIAEIVRNGTVIFIDLRSPNRGELERHRRMFFAFLQSLRIST